MFRGGWFFVHETREHENRDSFLSLLPAISVYGMILVTLGITGVTLIIVNALLRAVPHLYCGNRTLAMVKRHSCNVSVLVNVKSVDDGSIHHANLAIFHVESYHTTMFLRSLVWGVSFLCGGCLRISMCGTFIVPQKLALIMWPDKILSGQNP